MNKAIICTMVLLAFSFISCSSDSNSAAPPVNDTFKIAVNGVDYSGDNNYSGITTKTEDTFLIETSSSYGKLSLSFTATGKLGFFTIDRHTGDPSITSLFYTSYFRTADNFTFYLISVDESNKRIKGSYSGYVYANPRNTNSEKKFITGDFDLKYEDNIPGIFGLSNKAQINGIDWLSDNRYTELGAGGIYTNVAQHDFNGSEYEIIITINHQVLTVGTYTFSGSDSTPKVELVKYDPGMATTILYHSTGTLNVTKINNGIVYANYSFTAVNPLNSSDVTTVTNGEIKFIY